MKFIMLIKVKIPTIVGILTFIIMINTSSEDLKERKIIIFQHFSLHEQLKFQAQLSLAWKQFRAWTISEHTTVCLFLPDGMYILWAGEY